MADPRRTALLALLLAAALPAQIWSEEFDVAGAPDPAVWSYDLGGGGWGNSELQTYTSDPANVRVENGHLVITAIRQGASFTSARIRTQDKLTFQYGTVEARIQVPDLGDGLWPAFWTLGDDISSVGWPDCGEIDVLEMGAGQAIQLNQVNRRVYSTAHWESNGAHAQYGLSQLAPGGDVDGSFHVWRLDWTPTSLTTFLDGALIWSMTISNPAGFDGQEFHQPHFFILNLAVGGNFPGLWNAAGITAPTPAEYRVDYIRVYDNGHTILGGSALSTPAAATSRPGPGNLNSAYFCSPPALGQSMSAYLFAFGRPYQFGGVFGFLGAGNQPFGSYTMLVDPVSAQLLTLPISALQAGAANWTVPIPANNVFMGLPITTQGVLLGPDVALTNAVDLVVGS